MTGYTITAYWVVVFGLAYWIYRFAKDRIAQDERKEREKFLKEERKRRTPGGYDDTD